ncbi:hypothetical protein LSM04_004291 [Trypanosoma melophagium]|uniref:uncharacterized protein n=1 Tax=Trypanosoma melophagium TaxID=715481 RepID=UPI00351A1C14|nr:hypothetical protein LSM04_004291 [Trypanosoma melophagium]
MDSVQSDSDYDLFTIDRAFILSLFHAFCTAVPDDIRTKLAQSEADALQFLMVIRPRLTSFSHRHVTSLRHPAVSMAARQYYNAQRAAIREEARLRGEPGVNTQNMNSSISTVNNGGASRTSLMGSMTSSVSNTALPGVVSPSVPFTLNIPNVNISQLMQNKWSLLGPCYELMLRYSKPRQVATQVIEGNDMVNEIISRYWERITVPPGEYADMEQSFSIDASDTVGGTPTTSFSRLFGTPHRTYATHMTALQYVYLNLRISSVLLPPDALESEMLDSILADLRIDATSRKKLECVSFEKAPQLYGHRDSDDTQTYPYNLHLSIQRLREVAGVELAPTTASLPGSTGGTTSESTPEAAKVSILEDRPTSAASGSIGTATPGENREGGGKGGTSGTSTAERKSTTTTDGIDCSLSNLPDISFGQFWNSMLELADNWTSTTHPMEQAIFLMELYCEVFAHEWDDEDAALVKTLRGTVAERSSRRQDDLLSLYDESERSSYMIYEFNQMLSSIADLAASGISYAPNLSKKGIRAVVSDYVNGVHEMLGTPQGSMESSSSFGNAPLTRRITAAGTGETSEERHPKRRSLSLSSLLITESGGSNEMRSDEDGEEGRKRKRHAQEGDKRDGSGKRRHRRSTFASDASHIREERDGSMDYFTSMDSLLSHPGKRSRRRASERESTSINVEGGDNKEGKRRSGGEGAGRGRRDKDGKRRGDGHHHRHGSSAGSSRSSWNGSGSSRPPWGSDSSLVYSVPDSELTPLSLWRREKEQEERRKRRQQRQRWAEKHRHPSRMTGKGESKGAAATLSADEMAERRARIVEALRAKGIHLAADFFSDDDIIQLTSDTIDPLLLRRMMQGAGIALDELSEEEFLRIMLGEDDQLLGAHGSAADRNSVLAALRKQKSRHPPETAYARRRREMQEQLIREQERAAARAARKREKKRSRRRNKGDEEAPSPTSDIADSVQRDVERQQQRLKQEKQKQEEELLVGSSDSDSLAGLWTSTRRSVISPPPVLPGLPQPHPFLPSPSLPRLFGPPITSEIICDTAPEVHLHSEEKLEMFYRNIRKDQPFKGRAPLAPQTSIRGGTYHQMSLVRARLGRGQQQGEMAEEETQQRQCAPVKLFSLTTKTSFAEALRESLQRYLDDKTYLDSLYGSYSK